MTLTVEYLSDMSGGVYRVELDFGLYEIARTVDEARRGLLTQLDSWQAYSKAPHLKEARILLEKLT